MIRGILFHPESREDIQEAFDWYEKKRPGLGDEFLLVVEAGVDTIRRDPE